MTPSFKVGPFTIGEAHVPFIIAEMSGNHNQSLERALAIVDAAAACGAHAMKIQTYTADSMTLDLSEGEFSIRDEKSLWNGRTLYDLYREASTPYEWHQPLFQRCRDLGMVGFSTPFDPSAVDFLEELEVPLYKVASFELVDHPLIKRIAKTGKPIIMSTGMATEAEIAEAVQAARSSGNSPIVLLKCTSTYPASPEDTNIRTIREISRRFGTYAGLSDHTMGIGVAVASVALGACVIEKHFTLKRSDGGVDSAFSLEPDELKALVIETKRAHQSLGSIQWGPSEKEKPSLQFRRSLYIASDMKQGDLLNASNLRPIRPGFGLSPKHFESLIGKPVNRDLKKGTPMKWDWVENQKGPN